MTDYDPRIVDLYDEDNPDGPDHDFYRFLADEREAQTILDLGCGTGILTVTLAKGLRKVVGIDPSSAMIRFARNRSGAEHVTWIEGDSSSVPSEQFDYVIMTGNVTQHIQDSDWMSTLHDLRRCMQAGSTLAFESRNPLARAWEDWTSADRARRETRHGTLEEWMDVELVDDRAVRLVAHNRFVRTDTTVTEEQLLMFRSRKEIERHLRAAGFEIEAVYGDWAMTLFDESAQVMVFVARPR